MRRARLSSSSRVRRRRGVPRPATYPGAVPPSPRGNGRNMAGLSRDSDEPGRPSGGCRREPSDSGYIRGESRRTPGESRWNSGGSSRVPSTFSALPSGVSRHPSDSRRMPSGPPACFLGPEGPGENPEGTSPDAEGPREHAPAYRPGIERGPTVPPGTGRCWDEILHFIRRNASVPTTTIPAANPNTATRSTANARDKLIVGLLRKRIPRYVALVLLTRDCGGAR